MSAALSGHALQAEGAAFVVNDRGIIVRARRSLGVGGYGRAWCECGDLSPLLDSGNQRKQWHRDHKAGLR